MALARQSRLSCSPEVLSRVLDGEAILLHLGRGMYFGTNEVASVIWEQILQGTTVDAVLRRVVQTFEIDEAKAEDDLSSFVNDLVSAGLCTVTPPEAA
jgi:hypothetical protein